MVDTPFNGFTAASAVQAADIFLAQRSGGGVNFNAALLADFINKNAVDGTAAAPGMAFVSDPDTGIYRPGANAVGIATGGIGRLTVTNVGKIGVGTSSPSETVHLYDSVATNWVVQRIENGAGFMKLGAVATSGDAYVECASGKYMRVKQNGVDRIVVDASSGNTYLYGTSGALLFVNGDTSSGAYQGVAVRNNYGTGSRDAFGYHEYLNENGVSVANDTVVILANGSTRREWNLTPSGSRTADRRAIKLSLDVNGLYAGADNAQSLGWSGNRWSVVYAATGTINTSDERSKQDVGAIPDEWLDAWGALDWVRFKVRDSVSKKGWDAARWHIGLVAQQVRDAFIERGLDAQAIGLLCYDEWEEEREPIFEDQVIGSKTVVIGQEATGVLDAQGQPIMRAITEDQEVMGSVEIGTRVKLEAGDRWGLRYDECQAMEAAWQRRELARKDMQIADLSARLAALEAA